MMRMNRFLRPSIWLASVAFSLQGCSLSNLVDVNKPQTGSEIDHEYLDTRAGALGLLNYSLGVLQSGVSEASFVVGVFTDELTARPVGSADYYYGTRTNHDTRAAAVINYRLNGLQFTAYGSLQAARVNAGYAQYFLRRQADSTLNFAISGSYSIEGYAITILAENLCSGVPLSESPYGQQAVYGKALPTDSLLRIAIAKFDSALTINHDSTRYKNLARIGKGRALLSLGKYEEAASAVAEVTNSNPFNLHYTGELVPNSSATVPQKAFWSVPGRVIANRETLSAYRAHEIVNMEGNNGMIWFSNPARIDPRVPVDVTKINDTTFSFPSIVRQKKFTNGSVILKFASWIDAKMIEAEYLLSTGNPNWIEPLNAARRTVGLTDTTSPTAIDDKINLLFRERAFWFYGHATRLADMRRLVRQYRRDVGSVYPTGVYSRSGTIYTYGDEFVMIPFAQEFVDNYNYSGCIHFNP